MLRPLQENGIVTLQFCFSIHGHTFDGPRTRPVKGPLRLQGLCSVADDGVVEQLAVVGYGFSIDLG